MKYLGYAIGEILLVVIGILIAVGINNWNENRKQNKTLDGVFSSIQSDLKSDTTQLGFVIRARDENEKFYLQVINDSLSREEFKACDVCPFLLVNVGTVELEERGYQQLKNFNASSDNNNDTLVEQTLSFYNQSHDMIGMTEKLYVEDIKENLSEFKNNFEGLSELLKGNVEDGKLDYFYKNESYKNRVAYNYVLLYDNYMAALKGYHQAATELLQRIDDKLKKD